jgi:hypothetical protein
LDGNTRFENAVESTGVQIGFTPDRCSVPTQD